MNGPREAGFALVAAVAGMAAFATMALIVLSVDRGMLVGLRGAQQSAKLEAAADAGLALTISRLRGAAAPRWADGAPSTVAFEGVALTIVVEDEWTKAPLNRLSESQARRLFALSGAPAEAQTRMADGFLDWIDDDEERRPAGAETADYLRDGLRSRDGGLRSAEELAAISGADPAAVETLLPHVTVWDQDGPILRNRAGALVRDVLSQATDLDDFAGDEAEVEPEPAPAAPSPSLTAADLTGRPLTVRVTARDGEGGAFTRSVVLQLTGRADQPYWIRQLN